MDVAGEEVGLKQENENGRGEAEGKGRKKREAAHPQFSEFGAYDAGNKASSI